LVDHKIIFGIRPEDIHNPQYAPPSIIAEPVETKVDVTELMGNEIFLYLVNGDHNFVARVDPRTRVEMGMTCRLCSICKTCISSTLLPTPRTLLQFGK
jgi:multiple sugar transport system ATP-binding protein